MKLSDLKIEKSHVPPTIDKTKCADSLDTKFIAI